MQIAYCSTCGEEFIQKTVSHSTCPKKECRRKFAEWKKRARYFATQNEMHKRIENKKNSERCRTTVVKTAIIHDMKTKHGYQYCELCGPSEYVRDLELHHIIYRSEVPSHPQKHSKINSILLHHECHEWFHEQKNRRDYLIVERKLWEVFDCIKKDYYIKTWRVA